MQDSCHQQYVVRLFYFRICASAHLADQLQRPPGAKDKADQKKAAVQSLGFRMAQSRFYLRTEGLKVGIFD